MTLVAKVTAMAMPMSHLRVEVGITSSNPPGRSLPLIPRRLDLA
jgi:hypothetical protein